MHAIRPSARRMHACVALLQLTEQRLVDCSRPTAAPTRCTQAQGVLQAGIAASGVSITIGGAEAEAGAEGASAGGTGTEAFLVKEALRRHTSEEPEGWKLAAGIDAQ